MKFILRLQILLMLTLTLGVPRAAQSQTTQYNEPPAAISSKEPSADIHTPVPIDLNEIVTGRLAVSSETGKSHYWLIAVPPGRYKLVLDVRRADDRADAFVGGNLDWFSTDGQKLGNLGWTQAPNQYRARFIYRFVAKKPAKQILRYSNENAVSDYWIGLFREDTEIRSPFFVNTPRVEAISVGEPVLAVLDGANPLRRNEYYSIQLRPGDYKVEVEFRRTDGSSQAFVSGSVDGFGPEGDHPQQILSVLEANESSAKKVGKLSLADTTNLLLRVQALDTTEASTFSITKWQGE